MSVSDQGLPRHPGTNTAPSPVQRGLTLIEVAVASTLLLVITGLSYGAVVSLHSATSYSETKLRQEASYRELMHFVREELKQTTFEVDAGTGQPRWQITTDGGGRQILSYQKIDGARLVGGELQTQWTPFISLQVNDRSQFTRTINGVSEIIARNIKGVTFVAQPGAFRVTITTTVKHPRTHAERDYSDSMTIHPIN